MSRTTDVILTFASIEDYTESEGSEPDHYAIVDSINEWLGGHRYGTLAQLDHLAGGGKVFCAPMFAACFNFFNHEAFVEFLGTLPWQYPERVQVFIMQEEYDEVFRILTLQPARSE